MFNSRARRFSAKGTEEEETQNEFLETSKNFEVEIEEENLNFEKINIQP